MTARRPIPFLAGCLAGLLTLLGGGTVSADPAPEPVHATALHGGGGGASFEARGPAGALLVGLRATTIVWAGHEIVRSLQPLFLVGDRVAEGPVLGRPHGDPRVLFARPGYAVGAVDVRAGHRLDGFGLVFQRIAGDRLEPSDAYESPWAGGHGGGSARLGGDGRPVVGIVGRHGADVDALGLLLRGDPPAATDGRTVRLDFSGRIDGSERIVIGKDAARWENVHWGTSRTTVTLGGVAWTPREKPVLPNRGATTFLRGPVDLSTARLVRIRGRDTVALEATKNAVTVRIADSPNGTDLYAFSILLDLPSPFAELSIRATIDGSDEILVTTAKATWRHRHWGWPQGEVQVNDATWDPRRRPELANEGATRYLPPGVDLSTARVVHRAGRDLAAVEVADDHLVIRLVDTPVGAAVYELVIRFGPDPRELEGSTPCE